MVSQDITVFRDVAVPRNITVSHEAAASITAQYPRGPKVKIRNAGSNAF